MNNIQTIVKFQKTNISIGNIWSHSLETMSCCITYYLKIQYISSYFSYLFNNFLHLYVVHIYCGCHLKFFRSVSIFRHSRFSLPFFDPWKFAFSTIYCHLSVLRANFYFLFSQVSIILLQQWKWYNNCQILFICLRSILLFFGEWTDQKQYVLLSIKVTLFIVRPSYTYQHYG